MGKTENHSKYQIRKTTSIFARNKKPSANKRKTRKLKKTPKAENRGFLLQKPKTPKPPSKRSLGALCYLVLIAWVHDVPTTFVIDVSSIANCFLENELVQPLQECRRDSGEQQKSKLKLLKQTKWFTYLISLSYVNVLTVTFTMDVCLM